MISDQRPMVAKRLVEYIRENPTSSSIILTHPNIMNKWRLSIFKHMKKLNIRFQSPTRHLPIMVEGNENKHHPTVQILNCGNEDIKGRIVTGVLLLDIFFLKETSNMRRSFELTAEYRKNVIDEEWLKENTPLSFHIETALKQALGKDAQVWTVGYNEKISPAYLDSLLPDNR